MLLLRIPSHSSSPRGDWLLIWSVSGDILLKGSTFNVHAIWNLKVLLCNDKSILNWVFKANQIKAFIFKSCTVAFRDLKMTRSAVGLKKKIRFEAGLIQSAENGKVTKIQCLPSRSSQSGAGVRHVNSDVRYLTVNALMQGISPVLVKVQRKARQLCLEYLHLLQSDAVCRGLRKGVPRSRLILEKFIATGPPSVSATCWLIH